MSVICNALLIFAWLACGGTVIFIVACAFNAWRRERKQARELGRHNSLYDSPEKPTMEEWVNGRWDFSDAERRR